MQGRARQAADRLIGRHGGSVVLARLEGDPPANPWDPPSQVEVEYTIPAVETGFTAEHWAAGLVHLGDLRLIVPAGAEVVPAIGDTIRTHGRDFAVLSVEPVRPAPDGAAVATVIHARR